MAFKIVLKPTERGFQLGGFEDQRGAQCSIQESSASEQCIWLGCDVDYDGRTASTRMHLTTEMAAALIPHLKRFVESGDLSGQPAEEGSVVGLVITADDGQFLTRSLVWDNKVALDAYVHPEAALDTIKMASRGWPRKPERAFPAKYVDGQGTVIIGDPFYIEEEKG